MDDTLKYAEVFNALIAHELKGVGYNALMNKGVEALSALISDHEINQKYGATGKKHVIRWVEQFEPSEQLFVLLYTSLILNKRETYLTKKKYKAAIERYILSMDTQVLQNTVFLDLQRPGLSQDHALNIMNSIVPINRGLNGGSHFVYFDDVAGTGGTTVRELTDWINGRFEPNNCELSIVYLCGYTYGCFDVHNKVFNVIQDSGKNIRLTYPNCVDMAYENRKTYSAESDVLWPTRELLQSSSISLGAARENFIKGYIFKHEALRNWYESIMLKKGLDIINRYNTGHEWLRPLGFSSFYGAGFGGIAMTYRNCPNNTPLPFWFGPRVLDMIPRYDHSDPNQNDWYPLFIREKY